MFTIVNNRKETRNKPLNKSLAGPVTAMATAFVIVFVASTVHAGRPPTPDNFRVTAQTAYTVTVAWNPPRNNSGNFNYHLSGAYGVTPVILPKTATSHTFTGLHPANQYWFFIYAREGNNTSGQATTTTRTLLDTTPPSTAPVVTVNQVGTNYAAMSWTAPQDDSPYFFYEIWIDGSLRTTTDRNVTSTVLRFLSPSTAYNISVRGRDEGHNFSPFSTARSITTLPPNPNDHTSPTVPTNVSAYSFSDGSTEMQVQWTQSTDNFDAQSNIRYDVFVNGRLEDIRFGSGGPIVAYGDFGENRIEVVASDTAGNSASPATTTIFIP